MLQPGQLARQLLVRFLQLSDPLALCPDQRDQVLTRQLLQLGHHKIEPHQTDSPLDSPVLTQPATITTLRATAECLRPGAFAHWYYSPGL
jgi:hypothetical protein